MEIGTGGGIAIGAAPGAGTAFPFPGGAGGLLAALAAAVEGRAAGGAEDAADRADVAAALGGDGEAYARIVRRHQRGVTARLWRFTRDRGTLEELVQSTFVEAWRGLRGFRGEAPLEHWLHRIAVRTGFRHWRERRVERERGVRPLPPDDVLAAAPEDPARAGLVLHDLLERLAPRDRLVLTLLAVEGHSVAEAAALTGWSATMVKVQAHRARARLRRLLEDPAARERGRP
jgi:RNA polymerase sigma-70 factor (ECF subfamily)